MTEQLIDHDRCGVLSDRQYATYWEKGFLVIRGLLDDQSLRILRAECESLALLTDKFDTLVEPRKSLDGSLVRERLEALSDRSPTFHQFARDERVQTLVRRLFDADACLFKDKIHFRPPGTTGFRLHQDYTAYEFVGIPAADIVTIMIAIDPVTRASGALEVFSGYHNEILPEPANDPRAADPRSVDQGAAEIVELEPGDACAFHSLTPHRSTPNVSDRSRRTVFVTYNHARHGDCYQAYYAGREDLYR